MCGESRIVWCVKELIVMRDRKTGEVISSVSSTSTRSRVAAKAEVRLPIVYCLRHYFLREERLDFCDVALNAPLQQHIIPYHDR